MRRLNFGWGTILMVVFVALFTTACGGGGGDDAGTQNINYSGNKAQAVLTDSSVEDLTVGAYQNGEQGGGVTDLVNSGAIGGGATFAPAALPGMVGKAVSGEIAGGIPKFSSNGSLPGSCGGSASFSISTNEVTGSFSYTFSFKSFCETDGLGQTILNGAVSFSGQVNLDTGEVDDMTATFSALTARRSDDSENVTLSGRISVAKSGATSATMTMNYVVRDNLLGKTYWVRNYVVEVTDYGTYQEISVSGRFYHFLHGYVDISTVTPMQIYTQDEHPAAGMLQIDGAAGNSARIGFLTPTTYQVTADLNGDGVYDDFDSGEKPWQ